MILQSQYYHKMSDLLPLLLLGCIKTCTLGALLALDQGRGNQFILNFPCNLLFFLETVWRTVQGVQKMNCRDKLDLGKFFSPCTVFPPAESFCWILVSFTYEQKGVLSFAELAIWILLISLHSRLILLLLHFQVSVNPAYQSHEVEFVLKKV